jgi:hypothetical protein
MDGAVIVISLAEEKRYLSEEISSRVAECTRLILVKDRFGGDLGTLDQCVDGHRKNTRILEWFGPPERNTLRPLWCCIDRVGKT